MAEEKGSGGLSHLTWFIIIMAVLWFVWVFTGGPERAAREGSFLNPPNPIDSGDTYGRYRDLVPGR